MSSFCFRVVCRDTNWVTKLLHVHELSGLAQSTELQLLLVAECVVCMFCSNLIHFFVLQFQIPVWISRPAQADSGVTAPFALCDDRQLQGGIDPANKCALVRVKCVSASETRTRYPDTKCAPVFPLPALPQDSQPYCYASSETTNIDRTSAAQSIGILEIGPQHRSGVVCVCVVQLLAANSACVRAC